jgi:hypothetical protein
MRSTRCVILGQRFKNGASLLCFFFTFLASFYLMTRQNRRRFLQCSAALSALGLTSSANPQSQLPSSFSSPKPLGDRVRPITPDEFHRRLRHAQQLMSELDPKFDVILMGPGTSLYYFTISPVFDGDSVNGYLVSSFRVPVSPC